MASCLVQGLTQTRATRRPCLVSHLLLGPFMWVQQIHSNLVLFETVVTVLYCIGVLLM
jgi:hypothetical protein